MRADEWLVVGFGILLIILTYWFFLGPAERNDHQEHHH